MSLAKLNFVIAFVVGLLISEIVRDLLNVYDNRTNPDCPGRRDGIHDAVVTTVAMLFAIVTWYITGYYGILKADVQIYSQSAATLILTGRNVMAWVKAGRRRRRRR